MWFTPLSNQKRYLMLVLTAAVTILVAFLSAPSRNEDDAAQDRRHNDGFGSAEEAFDMSCRILKEYLSSQEGDRVRIDPQFRASLLSKSKIWTVKGYAYSPKDEHKSYRWTVVLNYHDMQEWEVLARIVTPEFTEPNSNQTEGLPQVQGKVFQEKSK